MTTGVATNNSGGRWNGFRVREVTRDEVPIRGVRTGLWNELYQDILKRLEQTPAHLALCYELRDAKQASNARLAVQRRLRDANKVGYVMMVTRGAALYVARGINYGK